MLIGQILLNKDLLEVEIWVCPYWIAGKVDHGSLSRACFLEPVSCRKASKN